jgi:hypothetical protein
MATLEPIRVHFPADPLSQSGHLRFLGPRLCLVLVPQVVWCLVTLTLLCCIADETGIGGSFLEVYSQSDPLTVQSYGLDHVALPRFSILAVSIAWSAFQSRLGYTVIPADF